MNFQTSGQIQRKIEILQKSLDNLNNFNLDVLNPWNSWKQFVCLEAANNLDDVRVVVETLFPKMEYSISSSSIVLHPNKYFGVALPLEKSVSEIRVCYRETVRRESQFESDELTEKYLKIAEAIENKNTVEVKALLGIFTFKQYILARMREPKKFNAYFWREAAAKQKESYDKILKEDEKRWETFVENYNIYFFEADDLVKRLNLSEPIRVLYNFDIP